MLRSYQDLLVWQRAVDLCVEVYRLAGRLPATEKYGLATQTCRAAVSISANIAEGYGRIHRGDYVHHLSIASGSLCELETHLHIAQRLRLLNEGEVRRSHELCDQVSRMLTTLKRRLRPSAAKP